MSRKSTAWLESRLAALIARDLAGDITAAEVAELHLVGDELGRREELFATPAGA